MQKCFYDPRDNGKNPATPDDGSGSRIWSLPAEVLGRHGACVLNPDAVSTADGWPAPASTVYRKGTLLLPADLHEEPSLSAFNEVLGEVGMRLVSVPAVGEIAGSDVLAGLPRTAVLVPASSSGQVSPEGGVDAWAALTALRGAAKPAGVHGKPALSTDDISRISLEHLLVGAAITGAPAIDGEPAIGGESVIDGELVIESYLYSRRGARTPVEMTMDAPARLSDVACAAKYGRRPVIAVLDTGVRAHPWLGVTALGEGEYAAASDGFVRVDQAMQDIIYAHGKEAAAAGDQGRRLIKDPWDTPATLNKLVGEVAPYTGHGTFIAGIFRQVVPNATVLSIRIMHSDGIVYEGDLMCALGLLAARVAKAQREKNLSPIIDAVSLSLGYFIESAADVAYTSALRQVIDVLLDMGVAVTAAAGNYATSREYYPAAFAGQAPNADKVPLVSVGALNPNGTKAAFSGGGRWVTAWAPGAALISTFPVDVNGTMQPDIRVPGETRESLDLDDYRGGFAAWSGTSFSAPMMAADLIRAMLEPLQGWSPDPALRLDVLGVQVAADRILRALRQLQRTA
jgi:hypothetical protein